MLPDTLLTLKVSIIVCPNKNSMLLFFGEWKYNGINFVNMVQSVQNQCSLSVITFGAKCRSLIAS